MTLEKESELVDQGDGRDSAVEAWTSACERARVAEERVTQLAREANMQANRAAVAESNGKAAKRSYDALCDKAASLDRRIAAWEKHASAMRRAFFELGITGDDT